MIESRGPDPRPRWEWIWIVVPALAGAASAALSWQRWIRPFVDGSRELEVPARLADGERLYRDVAYYYGPAAPWVNGAALHVFGRRFAVLEVAGAIAAAILLAALYRLGRRAGSPVSAGVGVTIAAAICVGAPNGGSLLFPYAFAALFAVAAAFVSLDAAAGSPSRWNGVLASLALAFALLSKAEIGAAAAAAMLIGGLRAGGSGERRRATVAVAASALVAAAGYAFALRGISLASLGSESPLVLFAPPPEWRQVYRLISGLDDPGAALSRFATALFLDAVVLGAAWLVARASRQAGERPGVAEAVWWGVLLAALALCATPAGGGIEDRLPGLLSPAPLVAGLAALALLRAPLDDRGRARFLLFAFSAMAAVRVIGHVAYGFVTTPYTILALPGLAVSAAVLVLDVLAPRLPRPVVFRRAAAAAFLALAGAGLVRLARIGSAQPFVPVETAAGTLRMPAAWGRATALVLGFLAEHAKPGDTLSTFPEAGVFNFVTGLRNPLREEQLLPGHLDARGEAEVARRIRETGPRFVVLVEQTPPGWAAARFGTDYAREIARALAASYVLAGVARAEAGTPLIRVLERRPG